MLERDPRTARRRTAYKIAAAGVLASSALALGCSPVEPPPPTPSPPPASPEPEPPTEPDITECITVDSSEFATFQLNREALLPTLRTAYVESLGAQAEPQEVLIKVRAGRAAQLYDTPPMRRAGVSQMQERSGNLYLVQLDAGESLSSFTAALEAYPSVVEYAVANQMLYPLDVEPNDPCYAAQWHYWSRDEGERQSPGGIDLPARWEANTGSADVVVAVIDTGIADNFDASETNMVPGYDFVSSNFNAGDGDGRDPDPTDPGDLQSSFHGTHVAGTVGATSTNNASGVAGVNWDVSVQSVRALGLLGGSTSDIVDAIRWSAGLPVPGVPDNETPADIINMSLGGTAQCDLATQDAIDDATAAGTLVVAAAGNEGQDAGNTVPAGCDNVLTVAASDFRGVLTGYSNFGESVEILAPGGDNSRDDNGDGFPDGVLSVLRDGVASYNGTSMAAPHVAGVAALLKAENPELTPAELTDLITSRAIPRTAEQCPRPCGAGLLNATPTEG